MKFGFSSLVVSNTSVKHLRVMVLFRGFKYSSVVQQVHLNLKWAHYKLLIGSVFVIDQFCLEDFYYKIPNQRIHIYNIYISGHN